MGIFHIDDYYLTNVGILINIRKFLGIYFENIFMFL